MGDHVEERDYLKCWYCQNNENDDKYPLSNPANAPNCRKPEKLKKVYENAAKQAKKLLELGKQSPKFVVNNIIPHVSNEEFVDMMFSNKAVWHPNCRDLHNKQKVDRAET